MCENEKKPELEPWNKKASGATLNENQELHNQSCVIFTTALQPWLSDDVP